MTATLVPLSPFGARVDVTPGTRLDELPVAQLKAWVDVHKVVLLRGLSEEPPHLLAKASRRLGPLQPWPFGSVHELKQVARTENYLYTAHAVPLHWDGAFADAVPHYLVFECLAAPESGGETVFVDTARVLANATAEQRARWAKARVRYTTEKKAHYGGTFTANVIARHPTLGTQVIRFAEPVVDLNPVEVTPVAMDASHGDALVRELSTALAAEDATLALPWKPGDFVLADNHALLHGRRAFTDGAPRHIYRVNVLDPDRSALALLRAAWRVRRPEFFRAELPILTMPAFFCATRVADLASLAFAEAVLLFFLLFNVGDMVNCFLDRDVDLHRKTHLAEAVELLGRRSLMLQIAFSGLAAAALGAHLAWSLHRPWLGPAGIVGVVVGAGYTAPPLRLKGRGLLQLPTYVGILFVGPMLMVSGVFLAWPSPWLLALSLGFGLMQTGVLLVNTAEDLDEDEREGIRTAAVVLGAKRTVSLARAFVIVGVLGFTAVMAATMNAWWACLPVLGLAAWNERWLARLRRDMGDRDESACRRLVREQGKHVPKRIERGAWLALLAVVAAFVARAR